MPDYRKLYDSEWVHFFDLDGRDVTVTISEVKAGELKNKDGKVSKKPAIYFAESKDGKGLALNRTNGATIAQLYGTKTEGWIGKRITLFATTCQAFGKTEDCIRIRPQVPK